MLENREIHIELGCADPLAWPFPRRMRHLAESETRKIPARRDGAARTLGLTEIGSKMPEPAPFSIPGAPAASSKWWNKAARVLHLERGPGRGGGQRRRRHRGFRRQGGPLDPRRRGAPGRDPRPRGERAFESSSAGAAVMESERRPSLSRPAMRARGCPPGPRALLVEAAPVRGRRRSDRPPLPEPSCPRRPEARTQPPAPIQA
jgi:hypothetical protein